MGIAGRGKEDRERPPQHTPDHLVFPKEHIDKGRGYTKKQEDMTCNQEEKTANRNRISNDSDVGISRQKL